MRLCFSTRQHKNVTLSGSICSGSSKCFSNSFRHVFQNLKSLVKFPRTFKNHVFLCFVGKYRLTIGIGLIIFEFHKGLLDFENFSLKLFNRYSMFICHVHVAFSPINCFEGFYGRCFEAMIFRSTCLIDITSTNSFLQCFNTNPCELSDNGTAFCCMIWVSGSI